MSDHEMPYRTLGHTGERVSAIGLGGWHLALKHVDKKTATKIVHAAIDRGLNFMDNSWDYNDGESEVRMGNALAEEGYRDKAFLMTKIDGRSRKEAAKQIDESLKRLKTDRIDLVQHHEVIRFDDPTRIFDEEGAQAAFLEAKQAGKLRYIGFTGHKDPEIHLHMLEVAARHGFTFDAVQMPLNVMDAHYRSFARLVVPRLVAQNVGILAMKTMGNGIILRSGVVSAIDCLHYALNLPTSVVITGIDTLEYLDQAFEAARTFHPLTAPELDALLAKTSAPGSLGAFELFKTSSIFDATATHPHWLGDEPDRLTSLMPA